MIYGARAGGGEHGAVMTKPGIVELMLDICGYSANENLSSITLLEPAAGHGAFIAACMCRLHASSEKFGFDFRQSLSNLRAVELDANRSSLLKKELACLLETYGVEGTMAAAEKIVSTEDYLLSKPCKFDIIIGNPPYVRHENIPGRAKEIYRNEFDTFRNRSDIYIAFFEKSLRNLASAGKLCFICSDRWMQNTYGRQLRRFISKSFHVPLILKLHKISAFEEAVYGYPSIICIARKPCGNTRYLEIKTPSEITEIRDAVGWGRFMQRAFERISLPKDGSPWILNAAYMLLPEGIFSPMESQGFEIGIGIATGADSVYVGKDLGEITEKDVLMPLVMSKDIVAGQIKWGGNCVINVFDKKTGSLIDLDRFPRLKQHFNSNKEILSKRHVAKKNCRNWYKTIDKINPDLQGKAKLLLVDIKKDQWAPLDKGEYYPHHNLYYVAGRGIRDLKILGSILASDFFIRQLVSSSPVMHGGCPRWQAQNLRRIAIPTIDLLPAGIRDALAECYDSHDLPRINKIIGAYVASGIRMQGQAALNEMRGAPADGSGRQSLLHEVPIRPASS